MKKIFIMLICALTVCLLCVSVFAVNSDNLVVDNEALFSASEEQILQDSLKAISQKYSCELVVVTTRSFGAKTAQKYAEDYYDNHGYGYGSDYTGVLLLISEYNREYYICLTGEANKAYARGNFDDLEDEILPYLRTNDFYGASKAFAQKSEQILEKYEETKHFDSYAFKVGIVISIIVAIAVGVVTILVMRRAMNNARPQKNATQYVKYDSFNLTMSRDMYLYSTVRRVAKPKNNSSSSGGGRSHGGGGGRF